MHDTIFEHQRGLDNRHLLEYAAALALDDARVQRELASHMHAARVREDFLSGIRSGVNGTPTFFINGIRHDDSWDVDTLEQALRANAP
jgi:protein-disulfide isomerase